MISDGLVHAVQVAGEKCTSTYDKPCLVSMAEEDSIVVTNKILNEIAETFGPGYVMLDLMPEKVKRATYLFAYTCGTGANGGKKSRVIVASLETIRNATLLRDAGKEPKYTNRLHAERFAHLLQMHDIMLSRGMWLEHLEDDGWSYVRSPSMDTSCSPSAGLCHKAHFQNDQAPLHPLHIQVTHSSLEDAEEGARMDAAHRTLVEQRLVDPTTHDGNDTTVQCQDTCKRLLRCNKEPKVLRPVVGLVELCIPVH